MGAPIVFTNAFSNIIAIANRKCLLSRSADATGAEEKLRGAGALGRDSGLLRACEIQESFRVEGDAVFTHFEMQMRPGGAAGCAKITELLTLEHDVADLYQHF